MKRIILIVGIITMIVAAEVALSQTSQGVINYEVRIDMHRMMPSDRPEMKEMVPQFRTHKDQLFFNASEALYKNVEEDDVENQFDNGGGGQVRMVIRRPATEVYTNQSTSQRILLQELMGKRYLIKDTIRISPWKLSSETKTILNYTCKQATYYNEERKQQIVAWFTSELPPFLGPESFNTLPGAVLMVDINAGERTLTATGIELRELKKNEMKIPSGGTETTPDEFKKLADEQRERMRMNGGSGGGWIIRN